MPDEQLPLLPADRREQERITRRHWLARVVDPRLRRALEELWGPRR